MSSASTRFAINVICNKVLKFSGETFLRNFLLTTLICNNRKKLFPPTLATLIKQAIKFYWPVIPIFTVLELDNEDRMSMEQIFLQFSEAWCLTTQLHGSSKNGYEFLHRLIRELTWLLLLWWFRPFNVRNKRIIPNNINRFKDDNEIFQINKLLHLSDQVLIKGAGFIKCTSENCNFGPIYIN